MANRRSFLQSALGWGAGLFASDRLLAQTSTKQPRAYRHVDAGRASNIPVITPDIGNLPFSLDGGIKVFHLTAQVVKRQIAPNKTIDVWGFNGTAPGPTIQVNQGDRIRVVFDNRLPEATSLHWHGFEDQIGSDGMPGISQEPVRPGERFVYEFDIHQNGTYFYHSHMAMQEMAGMLGAFIMHPAIPYSPHVDKDFVLHLQEWAVLPNNTVPNTMEMEYNWLTLNGRSGPAATPLIVRQGDRVRIRFVNLGMDHHPMHLHGHTFQVTGTEGGRIPESAWWPGNTVLVGVAQARNIEFVANNPGDWMLHCHLPHHMMNQMSSNVGLISRGFASQTLAINQRTGQLAGQDRKAGTSMLTAEPGAPAGESYGSTLGRGMGFGNDGNASTTNSPLSAPAATASMQGMMAEMEPGKEHIKMGPEQMENMMAMNMEGMEQTERDIDRNADRVPNFPQDAYMESPMMNMEASAMLQIPENDGLRPGWSAYMQGMMTFVRVLPPDKYDAVIAKMRDARRPGDPYATLLARP